MFSRRRPESPPTGVEFVNESVAAFARRLRAQPGNDIWIMGGGELIASFLDAGATDELMMFVIPTFTGEGIRLIAPRHRSVPLTLKSTRKHADGVVRLRYAVEKSAPIGAERMR